MVEMATVLVSPPADWITGRYRIPSGGARASEVTKGYPGTHLGQGYLPHAVEGL